MKYAICPYCLATGKYKVKVTVDIPYKEYNVQKKSTNLGYVSNSIKYKDC